MRLADRLQKALNVPRFVFDNVAEYYMHHKKEYWTSSDFPNPMPPFPNTWVEYRFTDTIRSEEVGEVQLTPPGANLFFGGFITQKADKIWWEVDATIYVFEGDELTSEVPFQCAFLLGPNDPYVNQVEVSKTDMARTAAYNAMMGEDFSDMNNLAANYMHALHPVLMGLSLMNCTNVEVVRVEATKLNKMRVRKGKPEFKPYHVINVLDMSVHKKVTRTVQYGDKAERALGQIKLRRGSYASYGEKYGHGKLFGKYEGVYWRPATVRKDEGGDYIIKVGDSE